MTVRKPKTDPVDTRLRQILTEVLHDLEPDMKGDERAEIVKATLESYGDSILDNLAGLLALTMHELDDEEEDEEEED